MESNSTQGADAGTLAKTEGELVAPDRLKYLDGLRGMASLFVVIWHFCANVTPFLSPSPAAFTIWAIEPPFLVFTNGPFYVSVFFVLSGFVLAQSTDGKKVSWLGTLAARYVRLTLPMTASLIYAELIIILCNWSNQPEVSLHLVEASKSIFSGLGQGLFLVYVSGHSPINSALWTMPFELAGSFIIYTIYLFVPKEWRLGALILFVGATFFRPFFLGFALGALLREAWIRGFLRGLHLWIWPALVFAIYIAEKGSFGVKVIDSNIGASHAFARPILYSMGASCLIFIILISVRWKKILIQSPCYFLGRISFCLYLVHIPLFPIVNRVYSALPGSLLFRTVLLFPGYLLTALFFGWLMTILVDEPLVQGLHRWKKRHRKEAARVG